MGFWDKIKEAWNGESWDAVGNALSKTGSDVYGGFRQGVGGLWNMVTALAPSSEPGQFKSGLDSYLHSLATPVTALGDVGQAVSDIPVFGMALEVPGILQNEYVKRPATAAMLQSADFFTGKDFEDTFGSWDAWKRAYDVSETVSTGQAEFYSSQASYDWAFGRGKPRALTIDPRTAEGQNQYKTNWALKSGSGLTDAAIDFVYDPTLVLGKFGKLGKLKYLSKPMKAAAIEAGADRTYVTSQRAGKLFDYVRKARNADQVHQAIFAGKTDGGVMANALYDVAGVEDETTARRLFDDVLLSGWGDVDAWGRLTQEAPRIAQATGRRYANQSIGDIAKRSGEMDPTIEAVLDARRETDVQAFADSIVNGRGMWGRVAGSQLGQYQPRVSLTGKWRYGIHQAFNGAPITIMGKPIGSLPRGLRVFTPSAQFTRVMDLNDPNLTENFRANIEAAKTLSPERTAELTSQYARASSPEARFRIVNDAEDEIFQAIAQKHGFSAKEARKVLPQIRSLRAGARASFTNSRKFLSDDVRKVAETYKAQQLDDQATNLGTMADEIDAAVRRGEQPASVLTHIDEDGNLVLFPENFDITSKPLMPSQHADILPMMDWNSLHGALRWAKRGPIGEKAYTVVDSSIALAEAANNAWKVSTLLRPGYIWRTTSDDALRTATVLGASRALMGSAAGLARSAQNMWLRGKLLGDIYQERRLRRGISTHDVIPGEIEDAAAETQSLATKTAIGKHVDFGDAHEYNVDGVKTYYSYERALADGALSVDDLVSSVLHHADNKPGTLPDDLAAIVQHHREGGMDLDEFRKTVTDWALGRVNRDMYARPDWAQAFVTELERRHATKPQGVLDTSVLVDPFSGMSPQGGGSLDGYTFARSKALTPGGEANELTEYVREHADELLKPRSILIGGIDADGVARLAVGRADDSTTAVPKLTGGKRIKLPFSKTEGAAYRDAGADGFYVSTPGGPIRIDAAFEGAEGDRFRAMSSSQGQGKQWADRVTDAGIAKLMNDHASTWKNLTPDDPAYGTAWERFANVHLGNDPVARLLLSGRSIDDVLMWMRRTPQGRAYWAKLGAWQPRYVEQVHNVKRVIDMYLPSPETAEGAALRKKVIDRKARFEDLKSVVPTVGDMPMIHGASIDESVGHKFMTHVNNAVSAAFKVVGDMPADKAARFPLFDEMYRRHVDDLVKSYTLLFNDATGHDFLPVEVVQRAQRQARERALADVKKYLYDATVTHDMARLGRFMVPFGSAAMDSYIKWGRILKEKPWAGLQMWKAWTSPDRAGLIQDENGAHLRLEDGKEHWYSFDPTTNTETRLPDDYAPKDRYVVVQLPSMLQPSMADGVKSVSYINKDTFNTYLNWPAAGPIVAVPASKFALSNPEFADNKIIKKFVLPYGPQPTANLAVPAQIRSLYGLFNDQDGELASQQALAIYQTEMLEYAQGRRVEPPTFAEVRDKAASMKGLRFAYQMFGLSPTFRTPYQPYVDYYHQLRASYDPKTSKLTPDEQFYREAGSEYFILTASVTRNALGIPATVGGFRAAQKYKDLIDAHPDIANLIVGAEGAGGFSQAVYQAQLQAPKSPGSSEMQRYRQGLEDSVKDAQTRLGWIEYGKLMDAVHADMAARGLTSLQQRGAADLKAARDRWIAKNKYWDQSPAGGRQLNPWYEDFMSQDQAKMIRRINSLTDIINNGPMELRNRDDMRGLADYLAGRQEAQAMMQDHGYKTLNSKKAAPLRNAWNSYVFQLKDSNLSFAALYDRWLTGDQYLDAHV